MARASSDSYPQRLEAVVPADAETGAFPPVLTGLGHVVGADPRRFRSLGAQDPLGRPDHAARVLFLGEELGRVVLAGPGQPLLLGTQQRPAELAAPEGKGVLAAGVVEGLLGQEGGLALGGLGAHLALLAAEGGGLPRLLEGRERHLVVAGPGHWGYSEWKAYSSGTSSRTAWTGRT